MAYDDRRATSRVTAGRTGPASSRRIAISPSPIASRSYNGLSAGNNRPADLSPEQKEEIKEAFDIFDANHDKFLTHPELKVAMRALGFDVTSQDVTQLLRGQKLMGFDEFESIMTDKIMRRDPLEEITRAFKLFDEEGRGKISLRSLRKVAKDLNESIDDTELAAMIEEFDLDGDGEISLEEFISIMQDDQ